MGSAFHQLCPRYSGTLTPIAPTAIMLWETFTFYLRCGRSCGYKIYVSENQNSVKNAQFRIRTISACSYMYHTYTNNKISNHHSYTHKCTDGEGSCLHTYQYLSVFVQYMYSMNMYLTHYDFFSKDCKPILSNLARRTLT